MAVLLPCVLLSLLGLVALVRHEYRRTINDWNEKLSSIADGEQTYVSSWLFERKGDLEILASRPSLTAVYGSRSRAESIQHADLARRLLDQTADAYHYSSIYFIDIHGQTLASTTFAPQLPQKLLERIQRTSDWTALMLPDERFESLGAHICFSRPVIQSGHRAGFIVALVRGDNLFSMPFGRSAATRTGESHIIRQRKNSVVIFGLPRNAEKLSAAERESLNPGTLGVQTLEEHKCLTAQYRDYRNVMVLGVSRYIPEMGWGLVAKIDRSEALQQFYPVAALEISVALGLLGGLIVVSVTFWRMQQVQALEAEIARRRQVEQELRRSADEVRDLYNNAPCGYHSLDDQGCIVRINDTELAWLGYERHELVGTSYRDLLSEDGRKSFDEGYPRLRQVGFVRDRSNTLLRKDGTALPVLISATVICDEDGNFRMSRSTVYDLTERKRLEAQLLQSQKLEAIGRLAGGVAHDFNNILGIILGRTEMMEELSSEDENQHRKHVSEIKKAAERAAGLTRQLLAFSRKQLLQPRVIDLNETVGDLAKMLNSTIGENIELVLRMSNDLGKVQADPVQIVQVLMNLAINARDAMPKGGRLFISTENAELDDLYQHSVENVIPGPYICVSVADTGTGMDARTQSHLFEPFFTTKDIGKGTGLGLSIIYGIVKQSRGYIWVYSEPGIGSTFKIYLPRVEEGVGARERMLPPVVSSAAGSETVLVVEDESSLAETTCAVLGNAGYRVLQAASAEQALQIADSHREEIHLVLTDVVLPGMDGLDLTQEMRRTRPDIKVLLMSGYSDALLQRNPVDHEFLLLEKPFTTALLRSKVREVLDSAASNLNPAS